MEAIAIQVTRYVGHALEIAAAAIVAIALIVMLSNLLRTIFLKATGNTTVHTRIKFASSIALSLELMLAADVLATAIAPTWNDIGKLTAIAALRTALNFFLSKELEKES